MEQTGCNRRVLRKGLGGLKVLWPAAHPETLGTENMDPYEALKYPHKTLIEWCQSCSHCLGEAYDISGPYIANESHFLNPIVRFVSAQLLISCHLTSESVFLLLANQKIWDADILIRSVLDGTFKFVFILDGTEKEHLEKATEYWEILPEMARLSRHQRASNLLNAFKETNFKLTRPIANLMLTSEEEKGLRLRYPKRDRKKLAQKWSFMEIARHFAQHENKKYSGMGALGYSYGMQSHLVHQDGDGVGMVWDRNRREPERQISVELAHAGRLISDTCHFAFFRLWQLLSATKQPLDPVNELSEKYKGLFEKINSVGEVWHEIEYAHRNRDAHR